MITALLSAAWWTTAATGLYGRAANLARGPFGGALGVTLAAVVIVAALALGLAWLRGDAARDVQAACDAQSLAEQLAAERALRRASEDAAAQARAEATRRAAEHELSRQRIATIETEMEAMRDQAKLEDVARGRADVVFRADDRGLRKGAAPAAAPAPAR